MAGIVDSNSFKTFVVTLVCCEHFVYILFSNTNFFQTAAKMTPCIIKTSVLLKYAHYTSDMLKYVKVKTQ